MRLICKGIIGNTYYKALHHIKIEIWGRINPYFLNLECESLKECGIDVPKEIVPNLEIRTTNVLKILKSTKFGTILPFVKV